MACCAGLLPLSRILPAQQSSPELEPGSELEVYHLTSGVGQHIWERFGHNAIGIRDLSTGADVLYNYGVFNFSEPGFVTRFVQGRMLYWVEAQETARFVSDYVRARRSVWIQELNLTAAQRVALRDFLEWNIREENKFYRYDYYLDNCSTRVRDALDRVLGGAIRRQTDTVATGSTYRFHTQRLTTNDVAMYTGLLIGLGHAVDRPISAWEEMFLPLSVRERLRGVQVTGPGGGALPLVRSERTVFESDAFPARDAPPAWLPGYLLAGVGLGGVLLLLARTGRTRPWARTGFAMLATLWYLVAGLGGLVLLGLWAFTDHRAAYQNENVLQLNLLALPMVILLPVGLRRGGNAARATMRIGLVVLALSAAGLVVKVLPWFYQANLPVIALALPLYLGLIGGLMMLLRNSDL